MLCFHFNLKQCLSRYSQKRVQIQSSCIPSKHLLKMGLESRKYYKGLTMVEILNSLPKRDNTIQLTKLDNKQQNYLLCRQNRSPGTIWKIPKPRCLFGHQYCIILELRMKLKRNKIFSIFKIFFPLRSGKNYILPIEQREKCQNLTTYHDKHQALQASKPLLVSRIPM